MDINNLKHIVGQAKTGEPAVIRFFSSVNQWSAADFKDEFLWLQNCIKPSKICVLINSEGGSVIHGMSIFSVIQSCPIETDCIIEGIAASMGSVIWAAGDNCYMHDYSLLMIHNPFNAESKCKDECDATDAGDTQEQAVVNAFRSQLETIYVQRFGLSQEQVRDIMDGKGECDGTFFTADAAVKAGFLDKKHVLVTSKMVRDKAKEKAKDVKNTADLREIMSTMCAEFDENKLLQKVSAIHKQNDIETINQPKVKEMNENQNFDAISALLGLSTDAQMAGIQARIKELNETEAKLKDTEAKLTALDIQLKGKESEVSNLSAELETVKASLKTYEDAEKAAFEAKIEATVDAAIEAGKIEASAKESWVKMANADFATVEATLASIQGREVISNAIANEPSNVSQAEAALKTAEEKMQAEVEAVVGKFSLKSF